ncbi:hypothetical protein F5141DRAFT_1083800 [Pisolithus sp. B1]|nr:hypothetical protein F5141DRAFT_1083800 [Pisolithus sp. B1]
MSSYGQSRSELNDPANIVLRPSNKSSHSLSLSHQRSAGSGKFYLRFRPLPPVPHLPHNSVAPTEVWQSSMARQCRPLPVPPYHGCSVSLSGPPAPVPPLRRAVSLPQNTSTSQMMSERRRKKLPLLVLDSPTMVSMLTRQHASNSFSAVSESAAPATQLSQPLSRVSSLSSVASSTSESPGTDLGSLETTFCKERPRREARIFVIPNHGDLERPYSIETIKPSQPEATPSAEIVSPAKSQHSGLAGLNCVSHGRCAPSPTVLATVRQTQCRFDCKHRAALTIRIPMSTSSLPLTETSSESGRSSPCLAPITPQSPSFLRRRRFSKLRRHFGEAPPVAMVFGSEPGPCESSKPNMRCADAPASPLRLPTKKWVWDKGGRRRTASNYADVVQYLREL